MTCGIPRAGIIRYSLLTTRATCYLLPIIYCYYYAQPAGTAVANGLLASTEFGALGRSQYSMKWPAKHTNTALLVSWSG
jgi:hypothetical protein